MYTVEIAHPDQVTCILSILLQLSGTCIYISLLTTCIPYEMAVTSVLVSLFVGRGGVVSTTLQYMKTWLIGFDL